MITKLYYIKERHNPQLGTYYVTMGQLSKREAKRNENSIYGDNYMLGYQTEEEYKKAISDLKQRGFRILK